MARAISTESACDLAAVTKVHLAYITGSRDQKRTLRIMNLVRPSVPPLEYSIPSSWPRSIAICPKENYVVVGFDNALVRIYSTTSGEEPREDKLHTRYHPDCKDCQPVDTLSFSNDGLVLIGTTRSPKSGMIQVYCWKFPFSTFEEITSCRYQVPLHESEDQGCTSAIIQPAGQGSGSVPLVCITTWTQSGVPILIQPDDGHRTEIKSETSIRHNKLGNRVQCAAFSLSGTALALINDKGDLYTTPNLKSSPLEVKKVATSRELTRKSEFFDMKFVTVPDEDFIMITWADVAKGVGYVKKIPVTSLSPVGTLASTSSPGITSAIPAPHYELPADEPPAELVAPDTPSTSAFNRIKSFGKSKDGYI